MFHVFVKCYLKLDLLKCLNGKGVEDVRRRLPSRWLNIKVVVRSGTASILIIYHSSIDYLILFISSVWKPRTMKTGIMWNKSQVLSLFILLWINTNWKQNLVTTYIKTTGSLIQGEFRHLYFLHLRVAIAFEIKVTYDCSLNNRFWLF